MKIGTVIFTYNRPRHTKEVLDSLHNNTIQPERMYIYHDGKRENTNDDDWNAVEKLIRRSGFENCVVRTSAKNKGLAKSIYSGVSEVLEECDAVIVLEDDCVVHPMFMEYMIVALKKYVNQKRVFQVCGNAYPHEFQKNGTDAFFTERIDTLGWGTWKDRWKYMKMDYEILLRIKKNPILSDRLNRIGKDLEAYLIGNLYGRNSSWATFWGMTVIEQGGYCLSAYESLVEHIGYDGTGENCGKIDVKQRLRSKEDMHEISLPNEIVVAEDVEKYIEIYANYFSREEKLEKYNAWMKKLLKLYIQSISISDCIDEYGGIKNVAIYGKGDYADIVILDIERRYNIQYIVLSNPAGEKQYRGISVAGYGEITDEIDMIIVIPYYDIDSIRGLLRHGYSGLVVGIDELIDRYDRVTNE